MNSSLSTVFVLICLVLSVNCGCEDKKDDGISGFFSDLGCSIKHGAIKVKDGVQDGYKYIKEKVTSDDDKQKDQEQVQATVDQLPEGEADIYKHIRESVPIQTTPNNQFTLDVRDNLCPPNTRINTATGNCDRLSFD